MDAVSRRRIGTVSKSKSRGVTKGNNLTSTKAQQSTIKKYFTNFQKIDPYSFDLDGTLGTIEPTLNLDDVESKVSRVIA